MYPLKTSENYKVFWCFQEVEKECIGNNWVNLNTQYKFSIDTRNIDSSKTKVFWFIIIALFCVYARLFITKYKSLLNHFRLMFALYNHQSICLMRKAFTNKKFEECWARLICPQLSSHCGWNLRINNPGLVSLSIQKSKD